MKTINSIEEIRNESSKISRTITNNRFAVIVLTPFSKTKQQYGVQFWTNEMIECGVSENSDKSKSTYCEKL